MMRMIWIRAAAISWTPLLRWRIVSGPSKRCVLVSTTHPLIPLFLALSSDGFGEAGLGTALFDHLVGAGEQRWRHNEAKRLGGLEVDDELELGGLFDRKFGGP